MTERVTELRNRIEEITIRLNNMLKETEKRVNKSHDNSFNKVEQKKYGTLLGKLFENRDISENEKMQVNLDELRKYISELRHNIGHMDEHLYLFSNLTAMVNNISGIIDEVDKNSLSNAIGKDKQKDIEKPMGDAQSIIARIGNIYKKMDNTNARKLNGEKKDMDFVIEHYLGYNYGYRYSNVDINSLIVENDVRIKDIDMRLSEYEKSSPEYIPYMKNMKYYLTESIKCNYVLDILSQMKDMCAKDINKNAIEVIDNLIQKYKERTSQFESKYNEEQEKLNNRFKRDNLDEIKAKFKESQKEEIDTKKNIVSTKFKSIEKNNIEEKNQSNINLYSLAIQQVNLEIENGELPKISDDRKRKEIDKAIEELESLIDKNPEERAFARAQRQGYIKENSIKKLSAQDYQDIIYPTIRMYSEIDKVLDEYAKAMGLKNEEYTNTNEVGMKL